MSLESLFRRHCGEGERALVICPSLSDPGALDNFPSEMGVGGGSGQKNWRVEGSRMCPLCPAALGLSPGAEMLPRTFHWVAQSEIRWALKV